MKTHRTPSLPTKRTLKDRQTETGRTLALNGKAWRTLRQTILTEQPLCIECMRHDRITGATQVDHINNDPTDNRRCNLQSLCASCHSEKTRRDYGSSEVYGCDINGMPLDPRHPWYRGDE